MGIKLGLPVHTLETIRIDYNVYGTGRQRQEMITRWLNYDPEASWDKLANALKEMEKHVAGMLARLAVLRLCNVQYIVYVVAVVHLAPI